MTPRLSGLEYLESDKSPSVFSKYEAPIYSLLKTAKDRDEYFETKKRIDILKASGFDMDNKTVRATVKRKYATPISVRNRITCFQSEDLRKQSYQKLFEQNM